MKTDFKEIKTLINFYLFRHMSGLTQPFQFISRDSTVHFAMSKAVG